MAARTKARRRALDVLFEAEMRDVAVPEVLASVTARRTSAGQPPLPSYAVELIDGVVAHQERIDEVLSTYAIGWTLDRMPAVDRNILRVGAYELLYNAAVPPGVAIAEAVGMAGELSTDDSPRFVNGLLSRLAQLHGGAGATA